MKKKNIVVIDSGLGGLHILKECTEILSNYNYIYIADSFNAPYGNKSRKQLLKIAYDLVDKMLKKYNPEIIVFACNTLTVNTIQKVREKYFKTKFVGIEPAIKQAKIYGGDTIIFATKSTLRHYKKLNRKVESELKQEYRKQNLKYYQFDKIYKISAPNLPMLIEKNSEDLNQLYPDLNKIFLNKKYQSCLNIVLGCTHFIAIKEQINDLFPNIKFFDGAKAIAKQVKNLASFKNEIAEGPPKIKIVLTNGDKSHQKQLETYFYKINN